MLNRYTDGKREIQATDKLYKLIYEKQGFKLAQEKKKTKKVKEDES